MTSVSSHKSSSEDSEYIKNQTKALESIAEDISVLKGTVTDSLSIQKDYYSNVQRILKGLSSLAQQSEYLQEDEPVAQRNISALESNDKEPLN